MEHRSNRARATSAIRLIAVLTAVVLAAAVSVVLTQPATSGAGAQVPAAGIDPFDLVSEQSIRPWQVLDLQPVEDSSLPDWDVLVWDFVEINGVMYVGGRFQTVRKSSGTTEHRQPFLAAFDVGTGQWISTFRPVLDDGVYALAASADGTRLLVGGEFTSVNGAPGTGGLAALDPFTGEPDPDWSASVTREEGEPVVMEILVASDAVYIGGRFSKVVDGDGNSTRRYNLARLDPATAAVDPTFDVPANGGRVMAMDLSPDEQELYLGGFFTSVGIAPDTGWMAMIETGDGTVVAMADPLDPNLKVYVFDLVVTDTKVWAGTERHQLHVWNRSDRTRVVENYTSGYGGDYQALHHHDGVMWVGGHFHGFERNEPDRTWYRQVNWLTAYNAETGAPVEGWTARMGARDGVFALTVDSEGKVWAGGDPTSSGTVPVSGFAVFPPRSADDEVNLARNATATQSSTAVSDVSWRGRTAVERCNRDGFELVGPAGAAVDGKLSGGAWECAFSTTAAEAAPWWQVDLGAQGEIDAIRLWNLYTVEEKADLADVWIAVAADPAAIDSTDPVTLAADPAVTLLQIPGELAWFHEEPVGVYGRFVRVFLNPDQPTPLRLPEVEVVDLPGVSPQPDVAAEQQLIVAGAVWRYLDDGSEPNVTWTDPAFDDAAWPTGPALLGFGDADIATETAAGAVTTYIRHEFEIADPAGIAGLSLDLLADDGAVVHLNGVELHRLRMPAGPIDRTTNAADTVWGAAERAWTSVLVPSDPLLPGTNVLAIEVHNNWSGGNDLAVDAALTAIDEEIGPLPEDRVLLSFDETWRYLDDGTAPAADWTGGGFDDVAWLTGGAQLGYGDGDEVTVIAEGPAPDRHITSYFRTTFDVDEPSAFERLDLGLIRDDGAVVHLNGVEVVRSNMAVGPIDGATLASDYAWGAGESEAQIFEVDAGLLQAGVNTVAVEVHSADQGSRDLSFALELIGRTP